jgi:hypothetical protein
MEMALRGTFLSAIFGLAVGARYGALSMAVHAVGVPLGMLAAVGLSAPAAAIAFSHFDLPVDLSALWRGAASALYTAGRALSGLAPGALLVTVTCETPLGAALTAIAGLTLASVLGARRLWNAVGSGAPIFGDALWSYCMLLGLFLVAGLIAARSWWLLLPMLGGPLATGSAT